MVEVKQQALVYVSGFPVDLYFQVATDPNQNVIV